MILSMQINNKLFIRILSSYDEIRDKHPEFRLQKVKSVALTLKSILFWWFMYEKSDSWAYKRCILKMIEFWLGEILWCNNLVFESYYGFINKKKKKFQRLKNSVIIILFKCLLLV